MRTLKFHAMQFIKDRRIVFLLSAQWPNSHKVNEIIPLSFLSNGAIFSTTLVRVQPRSVVLIPTVLYVRGGRYVTHTLILETLLLLAICGY